MGVWLFSLAMHRYIQNSSQVSPVHSLYGWVGPGRADKFRSSADGDVGCLILGVLQIKLLTDLCVGLSFSIRGVNT